MSVCHHVCIAPCVCNTIRGQKSVSNPLDPKPHMIKSWEQNLDPLKKPWEFSSLSHSLAPPYLSFKTIFPFFSLLIQSNALVFHHWEDFTILRDIKKWCHCNKASCKTTDENTSYVTSSQKWKQTFHCGKGSLLTEWKSDVEHFHSKSSISSHFIIFTLEILVTIFPLSEIALLHTP